MLEYALNCAQFPYHIIMDADLSEFIELVENRLFELVVLHKEYLAGTRFEFNLSQILSAIKVNEDMLLCLRAARDYGYSVSVSPCPIQIFESPRRTRLKSVFPYGHPFHGRDDEYGEIVVAN